MAKRNKAVPIVLARPAAEASQLSRPVELRNDR